jgi:hypothetical protein
MRGDPTTTGRLQAAFWSKLTAHGCGAQKFECWPGGLFIFFLGVDLLLLLGGRLLFGRGLLPRVCRFDL